MTRTSRAVLATVVVLAALAGGLGAGAASADEGVSTQGETVTRGAAAALAAPTVQEECSFPATRTDSTGTEVTLDESPEDVVVLGANTAQTVWELGESDHVVGMPVDDSTAYLEGSQNRTHVLDGTSVGTETVVDLDPDLVIGPGGNFLPPQDVQQLRDAGLDVYLTESAASLDDIRNNTRTIGRLLGACEAADRTVAWMNDRLSIVDDAVDGTDRPSVFYWLGDGYTAGSGTFQGDLVERAGATNAAANMSIQGWDIANPESIVAENPDFVLIAGESSLPEDHAIQQTAAAQQGNVVRVDSNYWNQAAPRVVLAVGNLTQQLHGDAYQDAEESAGSGGEDSVPGFGVPVAVAALLGGGLALGRR